ncbi:MAG TPA: band 7 protein, partial [Cyanobacteria bacterium UBA11369]|nr:band 7 protein [Cyanobacteria bacterium UBA11369]
MKSFKKSSKLLGLAASVFASMAVTSFTPANAAHSNAQQIPEKQIVAQQVQPAIPPLVANNTQIQTMQVLEPWGFIPIVIVGGIVIFVPLFFG